MNLVTENPYNHAKGTNRPVSNESNEAHLTSKHSGWVDSESDDLLGRLEDSGRGARGGLLKVVSFSFMYWYMCRLDASHRCLEVK